MPISAHMLFGWRESTTKKHVCRCRKPVVSGNNNHQSNPRQRGRVQLIGQRHFPTNAKFQHVADQKALNTGEKTDSINIFFFFFSYLIGLGKVRGAKSFEILMHCDASNRTFVGTPPNKPTIPSLQRDKKKKIFLKVMPPSCTVQQSIEMSNPQRLLRVESFQSDWHPLEQRSRPLVA